jgi:hypothetical protein
MDFGMAFLEEGEELVEGSGACGDGAGILRESGGGARVGSQGRSRVGESGAHLVDAGEEGALKRGRVRKGEAMPGKGGGG